MSPDEVKTLRTRLRATTKELAHALEVEPATLTAWERGEAFPTKKYVEQLRALDAKGPDAIPRLPLKRGAAKKSDPMSLLGDPVFWSVIRKILAHSELRDAVTKMASSYDEPKTGD